MKETPQLKELQSLNLCDKKLTAKTVRDIAEILTEKTSLRVIRDVIENNLNLKLCFAALSSPEKNNLLTPFSQACDTLLSLNLSGNNLGDDEAVALASMLEYHKSLRMVNFSSNQITNSGAGAIARALRHNSTLKSLELGCNDIEQEGQKAIAQMLLHNYTLTYIYVDAPRSSKIEEGIQRNLKISKCISSMHEALAQSLDTHLDMSLINKTLETLEQLVPKIGTSEAPFDDRHPIAENYRLFQLLRDIEYNNNPTLIAALNKGEHPFHDGFQAIADQALSLALFTWLESRTKESKTGNLEANVAGSELALFYSRNLSDDPSFAPRIEQCKNTLKGLNLDISGAPDLNDQIGYLKSKTQTFQQAIIESVATPERLLDVTCRKLNDLTFKTSSPFAQLRPTQRPIMLFKKLLSYFSLDKAKSLLITIGLLRSQVKSLELLQQSVASEWLGIIARNYEESLIQKITATMMAELSPKEVMVLLLLERSLTELSDFTKINSLTDLLIKELETLGQSTSHSAGWSSKA